MSDDVIHLDRGRQAERALLARIFERARERGIDQASLAAAAGIRPESLSRLKRTGACRLATAFALARAVGLTRVTFAEPPTRKAAAIAARKLSAGRRLPITPAELVSALAAGRVGPEHRAHLAGFFEELPIESVHDVAIEESLDYARLLELARALGAEGGTVGWLAEMADDRVARAA